MDSRFTDAYDAVPNQRRAELVDAEVIQMRDGLVFDGYAAVFAQTAEIPAPDGAFREEIRHGAFRKVLATGANVPFLVEHDPSQLLGTTKSGRVRLSEDTRGLRVQANLADTDLSRRVKSLVEAGDVTGMSFGFVAGKGNTEWTNRNGVAYRTIRGFQRLVDVCTTWDPAYAGAEAQFRSLAMANPESAEPLQQFLSGQYWQLEEPGDEPAPEPPPEDDGAENRDSGVGTPLLAARKRRLQMLTITLEGEPE